MNNKRKRYEPFKDVGGRTGVDLPKPLLKRIRTHKTHIRESNASVIARMLEVYEAWLKKTKSSKK